ncbi:TIM-barrel domain-containing protein [Alteromonas sediminis]|nr:TIM-barrel domain-containing protein [Alteromonas sediminis]
MIKKNYYLALLLCITAFTSVFKATAADVTSFSHDASTLTIQRSDGMSVNIGGLGQGSVEVVYQKEGVSTLPGLALSNDTQSARLQVNTSVQDKGAYLLFNAPDIQVAVEKSPFRLRFMKQGVVKVEEEQGGFIYDGLRGVRFRLNDTEKLYGGGQRVMGMDRRGKRMPLYNRASYGYADVETDQMYYSLPAVMSSKHYAILFDNTAKGNLDIGHTEKNVLQFDAVSGRVAYVVSVADALPELVKQVVSLTGKQPLPPKWALGNFASRFGYRSEQQTREVVSLYNQFDIPLDAVVLDLYWFGPDIKGHMGNLDWDRNAFPTPEKMIADFSAQGVNTVVITEPFILTTSSQYKHAADSRALATNLAGEPRLFDFYFGNTGLVDVFNPDAQDWFWQHYAKLSDQGVSGWWGDLGEPEVHPYDAMHNWEGVTVTGDEVHNAYGHKWAQMVYERTLTKNPQKRPLVLMRSGFLGSQRYGMIPWTGDVARSWGGLKPQVELSLQMSVFGLAYTHSDLGGFAGGEEFDAEMYTRWLQAGVFTPVYRPHAQEHIPPEPVFHDQDTRDIVKRFIQLRYDLLPYNYSLAYENALTGMPLMRPLAFIDSEAYFTHDDSYLWGEAFLVQPVTAPGVSSVSVDLPEGDWFGFFDHKHYEGGGTVEYPLDINTLPVFVKAGAFVPMQPGLKRTRDSHNQPLEIHHWANASGKHSIFTLYEDDGVNPQAIQEAQYIAMQFEASHVNETLQINANTQGQYEGVKQQRPVEWHIHALNTKPTGVAIDGLLSDAWQWDEQKSRLIIKTNLSLSQPMKIDIAL